jgi:hypothetical protein
MELVPTRRLTYYLAVAFLSVALVACGAGNSDEPEATSTPSGAQPTVATTEEAGGSTPESSSGGAQGTAVPANIDMSTGSDAATPQGDAPGTATPLPATPEPGFPGIGATPATDATPVSGGSATELQDATPAAAEGTQGGEVLGDGTTGPEITPAGSTPVAGDAPAATPVATPAPGIAATPATPLAVTGCEVVDVPPFQGEPALFQLTVDVNFRLGPGTDCDLVMEEPIGAFQSVEVIGGPVVRSDDGTEWVQIEVLGSEGWVSFDLLEPVE